MKVFGLFNEGIPTISAFLSTELQLEVSFEDLVIFVKEGYPRFDLFSERTKNELIAMEAHSGVLRYDPSKGKSNSGIRQMIIAPFFRARVSVSLFLDKSERKSLLYRLTGESVSEFTKMDKEIRDTEENPVREQDAIQESEISQ